MVGRWSALPVVDADPTRRSHAIAEGLLERHGVVTRGAVTAEGVPGGFAAVYRVLAAFEDAGRTRRGYFVAGLGAAQFGAPGAVDRLRAQVDPEPEGAAITLAATDPANPYGAALAWPARDGGHRPGRKAGALVVLHRGELVLYVERGGRSLLSFSEDPAVLADAAVDLATAVRVGALGRITLQRADGEHVLTGADPLRTAFESAGFVLTPQGLRLRG
jgi:ATP-dependent Lhr-like helicase